jgi:hypothetical protein
MAELNFDPVKDYRSLYLARREVLTKNVSGLENGLDVLKARNFLNGEQLEKVREIRERKLASCRKTSYIPL